MLMCLGISMYFTLFLTGHVKAVENRRVLILKEMIESSQNKRKSFSPQHATWAQKGTLKGTVILRIGREALERSRMFFRFKRKEHLS